MKSLWVFMALGTEPRPLNLEPGEHMLYHTWPKEAIRTKQLIHTNTHTGNTWGRVFYVAKWTTYLRGKDPGEVLILETRQGWANVSSTVLTILATGIRQWRPQKGKSKPLICTGSNAPVATPATLKRANNSAGSQNGRLSGKKKIILTCRKKNKMSVSVLGTEPSPTKSNTLPLSSSELRGWPWTHFIAQVLPQLPHSRVNTARPDKRIKCLQFYSQ